MAFDAFDVVAAPVQATSVDADMLAALLAASEVLAGWTGHWGQRQEHANHLVRAALTRALGRDPSPPDAAEC